MKSKNESINLMGVTAILLLSIFLGSVEIPFGGIRLLLNIALYSIGVALALFNLVLILRKK